MALIGPVTLSISPSSGSGVVAVSVGYTVIGSGRDRETAQHYREVCHLVGVDSDKLSIIPGATVFEGTTIFTEEEGSFMRTRQKLVSASVLNEDTFGQDEIRAVVTLTPIPTSRESNLVRFGN
jgi:hypothetical protein